MFFIPIEFLTPTNREDEQLISGLITYIASIKTTVDMYRHYTSLISEKINKIPKFIDREKEPKLLDDVETEDVCREMHRFTANETIALANSLHMQQTAIKREANWVSNMYSGENTASATVNPEYTDARNLAGEINNAKKLVYSQFKDNIISAYTHYMKLYGYLSDDTEDSFKTTLKTIYNSVGVFFRHKIPFRIVVASQQGYGNVRKGFVFIGSLFGKLSEINTIFNDVSLSVVPILSDKNAIFTMPDDRLLNLLSRIKKIGENKYVIPAIPEYGPQMDVLSIFEFDVTNCKIIQKNPKSYTTKKFVDIYEADMQMTEPVDGRQTFRIRIPGTSDQYIAIISDCKFPAEVSVDQDFIVSLVNSNIQRADIDGFELVNSYGIPISEELASVDWKENTEKNEFKLFIDTSVDCYLKVKCHEVITDTIDKKIPLFIKEVPSMIPCCFATSENSENPLHIVDQVTPKYSWINIKTNLSKRNLDLILSDPSNYHAELNKIEFLSSKDLSRVRKEPINIDSICVIEKKNMLGGVDIYISLELQTPVYIYTVTGFEFVFNLTEYYKKVFLKKTKGLVQFKDCNKLEWFVDQDNPYHDDYERKITSILNGPFFNEWLKERNIYVVDNNRASDYELTDITTAKYDSDTKKITIKSIVINKKTNQVCKLKRYRSYTLFTDKIRLFVEFDTATDLQSSERLEVAPEEISLSDDGFFVSIDCANVTFSKPISHVCLYIPFIVVDDGDLILKKNLYFESVIG